MGQRVKVSALSTEADWAGLEPMWNALLERSQSRTAFLTWEWLRAWWRSYSRLVQAEHPYVLTAWEGERLIGIAPLYRSKVRAYGLGHLVQLRFIGDGSGDSEYLDFIVEGGRERQIIEAFCEHLDREGWDLLRLDPFPTWSPNLETLRRIADDRGYLVSEEEIVCSSLRLPNDWEEYLASLQSRFRTRLRSLLRRLPEENGATFEECRNPDRLSEDLETMFELHQKRWQAVGEPGSFSLPERREFYHEIARTFLERGWLQFHRLRLNGEPAAYEFSFEYGGTVYYLQQAFDIDRSSLSVGTALKAHVLNHCIERGVSEYDFLGGYARHKRQWGAEPKTCVRLSLARPAPRTRWHLWVPEVVNWARESGRTILPDPLLRMKRNLQGRLRQIGLL